MIRAAFATLLALSCLACGGTSMLADLGTGTNPPAGLALHVSAIRETTDGLEVDLELINESGQPFRYLGYSSKQPVLRYQYLTDKAWVQPIMVMCGTGLSDVQLGPNERVAVLARAYAGNRLQRFRIGIRSADDDFAVWSPMIDPVLLRAGTPRS